MGWFLAPEHDCGPNDKPCVNEFSEVMIPRSFWESDVAKAIIKAHETQWGFISHETSRTQTTTPNASATPRSQ